MNVRIIQANASRWTKKLYMLVIERPLWLWRLIFTPTIYCVNQCYFNGVPRKSFMRIWMDQFLFIIKYGGPDMYYFPYGCDVHSKAVNKEYIHYNQFAAKREKENEKGLYSLNAVLRDKFLFGMFASYLGVDSAESVAIISPTGCFIPAIKKTVSVEQFIEYNSDADLFIKPVDGECGRGILHLTIKDGNLIANGEKITPEQLMDYLGNTRYLVQSTVRQHPMMNSLHPESLNTIRLVTIRNPRTGEPEVFPSILRIGTGRSIVDNTSRGGLAVGIDLQTGRLKEFGFYKPEFGTKVDVHPDSGIRFSEFVIPHFDQCKKQAIFLHSMLPQLHSIGWDIAVGENGPIFVEGNDNWEINGPQICNGGLKKLFLSYC